ncbi:conserved hypothetical protein, partial [delta proteobacterium NaphS2]
MTGNSWCLSMGEKPKPIPESIKDPADMSVGT